MATVALERGNQWQLLLFTKKSVSTPQKRKRMHDEGLHTKDPPWNQIFDQMKREESALKKDDTDGLIFQKHWQESYIFHSRTWYFTADDNGDINPYLARFPLILTPLLNTENQTSFSQ